MARKLFGTDGIRGVAGEFPLDQRTAHAFGSALGNWAKKHDSEPEVVIGMDTRESGAWLAAQVAGGLARHGIRTRFAGLITTPGVAYLTRTRHFVAGVMISASHNPFQDNGLKAFDHSGFKLPDEDEQLVEDEIFELRESGIESIAADLAVDESLGGAYMDFLASTISERFDGMKLVLDCANGASSHLAPGLFQRLGALVSTTGCDPNGRNINLGCGTLHIESLRAQVLEEGADAGIAFDGDADRCIMVSGSGRIVDGDAVLLIVGDALQKSGHLKGVIVATVMSNLGLERALSDRGIEMLRTPVGDKYVLEEMVRRHAVLGGEQSGHIIFREYATTGDGMLTALQVLAIVRQSGRTLDELAEDMKVYPQLLVNVRVKDRKPLAELPKVQEEIRMAESSFGAAGRVLVRFSGTEPLARVMVEGPDLVRVEHFANKIAGAIRVELG